MARDRAVEQASAWFFKRLEAEEAGIASTLWTTFTGADVGSTFSTLPSEYLSHPYGTFLDPVFFTAYEKVAGPPTLGILKNFLSESAHGLGWHFACFARQHFFLKYLFTFAGPQPRWLQSLVISWSTRPFSSTRTYAVAPQRGAVLR